MGIIVDHQRRRCNVHRTGFITDHIIPYCISLDNSISNLQFLTKLEHNKKTQRDREIIKMFRKKGWIEKITNYSHELLKPIEFLKEEYTKELKSLTTKTI